MHFASVRDKTNKRRNDISNLLQFHDEETIFLRSFVNRAIAICLLTRLRIFDAAEYRFCRRSEFHTTTGLTSLARGATRRLTLGSLPFRPCHAPKPLFS